MKRKNKVIFEEKKGNQFVNVLITLIAAFVIFFFSLPALNITSMSFWGYIAAVLGIYLALNFFTNLDSKGKLVRNVKLVSVTGIIILAMFVLIFVINFILSPVFMSKNYAERITVLEDSTFEEDIELVDFDTLALLDKASSQKLGDRVMGQMPELVSQFYVSNLYTQINYNNEIIRVTPLEYNGLFKYISNYKDGVKGYITVDSVTGESKLVKLKKGMKYMPSAILMDNLDRKLRFEYPTKIFGEKTFELDNEGNPYWIVPTIKYSGVEIMKEIEGAIILDPITGKSKFYDVKDIPTWVDHVYSADLIIEQLDDWGQYKDGFLNSIFGQKNVTMTTDGYNYMAMNDDVYLYTGITSVSTDESNLGFVLTNMRTKETNFYSVPGAEEYSAMESAKGQVQQMKYEATFPLLINLNGKPTYLMSLKDNAGLVKMYAFVDVVDYQKVVVTDASAGIEVAAKNYLGEANIEVDDSKLETKEITVKSIDTAVIDGYTYYYIKDTERNKYMASISINKEKLPFVEVGSVVTISYQKTDNEVIVIQKIK